MIQYCSPVPMLYVTPRTDLPLNWKSVPFHLLHPHTPSPPLAVADLCFYDFVLWGGGIKILHISEIILISLSCGVTFHCVYVTFSFPFTHQWTLGGQISFWHRAFLFLRLILKSRIALFRISRNRHTILHRMTLLNQIMARPCLRHCNSSK